MNDVVKVNHRTNDTSDTDDETVTARPAMQAEIEQNDDDNETATLVENHAMPPNQIQPAPTVGSVAATINSNGAPRAGVEIIGAENRNGTVYHVMRDLRNGNIVHNVTRESARRLWHYAIKQLESNPVDPTEVQWSPEGDIGLWRSYRRGNDVRYDLVKQENNKLRVFYGVSDTGMDGRWQQFLEPDDE